MQLAGAVARGWVSAAGSRSQRGKEEERVYRNLWRLLQRLKRLMG